MPAIPVVLAVTGASAAIGAAAATAIGLGTVGTVAATAIGTGIVAGGMTALQGGDISDVLKSAVVGGATSYIGGSVAPAVAGVVSEATGSQIAGQVIGNVAATAVTGGDEEAILRSGLLGGVSAALKDTPATYEIGSTDVNADYSLANGTTINPLTDMGGASGLQAGTSANLADMGGAQGLPFNVGAPSIDTAYNIGDGIGNALADVYTGVYDSSAGILPSTVTNITGTDSGGVRASDVVNLINAGLVIADANDGTVTPTDANQYPIIPIPTDWASPPPTGVAPFTPLTPINFGDTNLLIGTQWERLLDPNYGQVPEPTQYSQPSSLSYNDLMAILGSKQGMPAKSSLTINDIISGIQNQYGQEPTGTMG
jgi:hypothetical protein